MPRNHEIRATLGLVSISPFQGVPIPNQVGAHVADQAERRESFSRRAEEIACCLPVLIHNLHARDARGGYRSALSRSSDIHVALRRGSPSKSNDNGLLV